MMMSTQILTLHLPDGLYARLQKRARESQRTLEAELLEMLSDAVPENDRLPQSLAGDLSQLDTMDDSELRRAARSSLTRKTAKRLEGLHFKRQTEGLSESEAKTLTELVEQYERAMVIRARAAALLKERGHDVSGLIPTP
jgi:plasmid stability protein